jgi:hypothetical protein
MATSGTLARLIRDLRGVTSPLDRMRVVARAWRSLRRLRPEERKLLATKIGLEGAEDLLEGIGRGEKRLAPVLLLQAIEKAKKADPSQLRGMLAGLKDPKRRRGILRQGLDAVSDALGGEEEAAAEEEQEPPVPPTKPRPVRPVPVQRPAEPPLEAVKPAPPRPAEPPREGKPAVPEPPREVKPVGPEPPREAKPAVPEPLPKKVESKPPAPPEKTSRPVPIPPVVPVPVIRPRPERPPEPVPLPAPPAPSPAGESTLPARLQEAGNLTVRFRLLRRELDRTGSTGDTRRLLEQFPEGWARRRALSALLRRRMPGNLEEALTLIGELEPPSSRRWCLGTILRHWDLSAQQRQDLQTCRRRASGAGPGVRRLPDGWPAA